MSIRYVSGPRNQEIFSSQQFLPTPQPSELTISISNQADDQKGDSLRIARHPLVILGCVSIGADRSAMPTSRYRSELTTIWILPDCRRTGVRNYGDCLQQPTQRFSLTCLAFSFLFRGVQRGYFSFSCSTDPFQLPESSSWCEGQQSATVYFV